MNREGQAFLLFLVGGAVLRASLTDLYLRYVKSGLRPLLIIAGVVLVAAGIATVWYEIKRARRERRERDGQAPEPGHGHREPRISWLLVLPVLALIVVTPPALGSYAADRAGTVLQEPPGYANLPPGDPVALTVPDYAARAVFDRGRSLAGRQVRLSGFISLDRRGTPYLTRMVLSCCAADAQPVKIGLSGEVPSGLRADAWLDVIGVYTAKRGTDAINGEPIPYIDVRRATPIDAPAEQYQG